MGEIQAKKISIYSIIITMNRFIMIFKLVIQPQSCPNALNDGMCAFEVVAHYQSALSQIHFMKKLHGVIKAYKTFQKVVEYWLRGWGGGQFAWN